MMMLLADFPDHIVAYRVNGKVNRKEYERAVRRRVDEVAKRYEHINFLILLEHNIESYSIDTLLNDLKVSFEHASRWKRMAIVSDHSLIRTAYDTLGIYVQGEIRVYGSNEFEQAKAWVSEL